MAATPQPAPSGIIPPFLEPGRDGIERQELFDWAVRALHAMPFRATKPSSTMCAYRTRNPDCPACIAGQLMTDAEVLIPVEKQCQNFPDLDNEGDDYFPLEGVTTLDKLDNPSFDDLRLYGLIPERLLPHEELITRFQQTHDQAGHWENGRLGMTRALRAIADEFKLDPSIINQLDWDKAGHADR